MAYVTSMRRPGTSRLGDETPQPTYRGFRFLLVVTTVVWFALLGAAAVYGVVLLVGMVTTRASAETLVTDDMVMPDFDATVVNWTMPSPHKASAFKLVVAEFSPPSKPYNRINRYATTP